MTQVYIKWIEIIKAFTNEEKAIAQLNYKPPDDEATGRLPTDGGVPQASCLVVCKP